MDNTILASSRDLLLYGIPLIVALFATMFRLDEILVTPSKNSQARRRQQRLARTRPYMCTDPDGTPW
jgi:hypothetical protein